MNLEFRINKPSQLVYDYLTDMQKYVSVHPVIYKIDELGNDNYLVHEKLNFGFIPFSFKYKAAVTGNTASKSVKMKAIVMKMVEIEMNFSISEKENQTIVNETITFKTFLPVKPILKKIFATNHGKLFTKMGNPER